MSLDSFKIAEIAGLDTPASLRINFPIPDPESEVDPPPMISPLDGQSIYRFAIRAPQMGLIHSIRLRQVDGAGGFKLRLFSCWDACPPGTTTAVEADADNFDDASKHPNAEDRLAYRIGPVEWVNGSGGGDANELAGAMNDQGWKYVNSDDRSRIRYGDPPNREAHKDSAIYAELEADGGFGTRRFVLAITFRG